MDWQYSVRAIAHWNVLADTSMTCKAFPKQEALLEAALKKMPRDMICIDTNCLFNINNGPF